MSGSRGNANGLMNALVGGWSVTGVGRYQRVLQDFGNVRLVGMTVDDLQSIYKFYRKSNADTGIDEVWMLPDDVILNTRRAYSTINTTATGYSTSLGAPEGRYIAPANSATCIQVKAGDCAPRNVLVLAPWFQRLDFGAAKKIGIGGSKNIEVRFDVLNLFDNPNFNQVSAPGTARHHLQGDQRLHRREQYLRSGRPDRPADAADQLVNDGRARVRAGPPSFFAGRQPWRHSMSSGWRAALLTLAVVGAASAPPRASAPQQAAPPGERPAPLTVDFVVVDADGTPITDLQAADIEIRIGDRVRAVRTLSRVAAAPSPAAPAPARLPPPYAHERRRRRGTPVRADRRSGVVPGRPGAAVSRRRRRPRRPADARRSHDGRGAAVRRGDAPLLAVADRGPGGHAAGDRPRARAARPAPAMACRTRRFLESLEGLLRNAGTRTTPVTVVIFTAGLAAPRRDAPMGLMPGMCELLVEQFRRLATVAGAARANVYVTHPADVALGSGTKPTIGGTGDLGSDNPLEGIEHLAGVTGAGRVALDATGTGSLLRIARETSSYYVAELEPVRGEVFGRTRPLEVRVARRGVTVRARPEITFAEPARTTPAPHSLPDLLAATDAFTDLRLRADALRRPRHGRPGARRRPRRAGRSCRDAVLGGRCPVRR